MLPTSDEIQASIVIEELPEHRVRVLSCDGQDFRLRRWLVSFASGPEWYPVGEFGPGWAGRHRPGRRSFRDSFRLSGRGNPGGCGPTAEADTEGEEVLATDERR